MSEVGYKKPPKNKQFGQPDGNPIGKTSKQRAMEIENAERATRIRKRMLEALEGVMNEHPEKEAIIGGLVKGDILRLMKEAEDRGLGTAKQAIDHTSSDGSLGPSTILIRAADDPSND